MPVESIEREIQVAWASLSAAAATVRYAREDYLHGPEDPAAPRPGQDPFRVVTALTAAHPWALAGFGEAAWDAYQPDPDAPAPEGLRVGVLRLAGRAGASGPPLPAVARFARHGHLLITESGFVSGKAPRPMSVVATGIRVVSAKARSSRWASAETIPPPA